jgi:hypothetical protein
MMEEREIASCCRPGGPCFEAGLAWAEHRAEPPPDRIFITFSESGENIRKWSREPFDGALAFVRA